MDHETYVNVDTIIISNEVMEKIAGIAVDEVEGALLSAGSFSNGIGNLLGRKNYSKGIKVETKGKEVEVMLSIMVEFGLSIQEVAKEIQFKIRKQIEMMTDFKVIAINVSITDVHIKKTNKKLSLDESIDVYQKEKIKIPDTE